MTEALREKPLQSRASETLDPQNWDEIRAQGHRMLDDMIDYRARTSSGIGDQTGRSLMLAA